MSDSETSPQNWPQSSQSTDDGTDEFVDQRMSGVQEVGDGELSTVRAQDGGGATGSELVNPIPPLPPSDYEGACLKPIITEESEEGRSSAALSWHRPLLGTSYTARSFTEGTFITRQLKSRESEQRTFIKKIRRIVKESPDALGLAILVASTRANPVLDLPNVRGIEKGWKMMETALRQLCYAVLCLPVDVPSSTLKTAMEAVASDEIQYPKNYRRFLFYYTGHGRPNTICTPDGNVELKCITDPLEKISDQSEEPIPIVLIFDSCSVGMLHSARNTLVISASLPDSVAYASTGQCGLLTEYLAPALTDPAHSNSTLEEITTHVTKEVTKVLKKHKKSAVRQGSTPVVFSRHLQETIRPQQERTKAMKPTIHPITEGNIHPTSVSVHVTRPQLANHVPMHHLLLECQCEGEQPKTVHVRAAGETTIAGLRPGIKYTLTAVAYYPNNVTAISSDETITIPSEVVPVVNPEIVQATSARILVSCHDMATTQHRLERRSVEIQRDGDQEWRIVEDEVSARRVTITGLCFLTQYKVRAVAHYPGEVQVYSEPKSFETQQRVEPEIVVLPKKVKATSVTISVNHPHMANQNGVQCLSVEYRRNGEQQWLPVQNAMLGGTVTITGLSSFTQYQARAVARYPGDVPVYSDPQLFKTQRKGYQLFRFMSWCGPISLLLLILTCVVMSVVVHFNVNGIPAYRPQQDMTKRILENDTIILFITNSFSESEAVISECPVDGDQSHSLKVFLLRTGQEKIHEYNDTYSAEGFTGLSRPTLLGDEYMLEGSFFVANICLTSTVSHSAYAYIFDSYDGNQEYVSGGTNKSSIYQQTLPVGNKQPICSVVNYTAMMPSYYYLSLDVPWNVEYNYSIFRHVRYLNYMDYVDTGNERCAHDISDLDCAVKLPGPFLSRDMYSLLVYSETTSPFLPKSTHVCVSFQHDSDLFYFYIICLVILILILSIYCVVFKICCNINKCCNRIRGYHGIV